MPSNSSRENMSDAFEEEVNTSVRFCGGERLTESKVNDCSRRRSPPPTIHGVSISTARRLEVHDIIIITLEALGYNE